MRLDWDREQVPMDSTLALPIAERAEKPVSPVTFFDSANPKLAPAESSKEYNRICLRPTVSARGPHINGATPDMTKCTVSA